MAVEPGAEPLEQVYTNWVYYGRPRSGVADFQGVPHWFDCVLDEVRGEFSNIYVLRAVQPDHFRVELELWELYREWYNADRRALPYAPENVLPHRLERYRELRAIQDARRAALLQYQLYGAVGEFHYVSGPGKAFAPSRWRVRWLPLPPEE